jgi:hypothetical protein
MRASAAADAAATHGKDAIKEVRAEAARYGETVEALAAAAKTVDEKYRQLSSRIDSEGTRTVAAADLKVAAIDQQLAELRGVVEVLSQDSARTREALARFEKRRAQAQQVTASTQADFDANSAFRVVVVDHGQGSATAQLGSQIVEALSKQGFKASGGVWAKGTKVGNQIKIDYRARAADKAELVRKTVIEALGPELALTKEIVLQPLLGDPQPQDPYDIRVFL